MSEIRRSLKKTMKDLDRIIKDESQPFLEKMFEDVADYVDFHIFGKIRSMFRKLKYGFSNLWRWKGVIWRARSWDWSVLTAIMRFQLEEMAEDMEKYSNHVGSECSVREMRLCVALLQEVEEGQPFPSKRPLAGFSQNFYIKRLADYERGRMREVGRIISRKLITWWY